MKGKNLVEACANVLVTSGYTDYAKNLWKPGPPKKSNIYSEISFVTRTGTEKHSFTVAPGRNLIALQAWM